MLNPSVDANAVNAVSQLIQLSVAPVFLLAAVGGILNVFTGRLSRIIDKVEKLDIEAENKLGENGNEDVKERQRERRDSLAKRMKNMNLAILFCTTTGLLVAFVIVIMFSSAMLEFDESVLIATLFIIAMVSFIISLTLFLKEIFLTTAFAKSAK